MKILQSNTFKRSIKKLHPKERNALDQAVFDIQDNPCRGSLKLGNLKHIRVHKFRMQNKQTLLAYIFFEQERIISLIDFGPHENFYRNLER